MVRVIGSSPAWTEAGIYPSLLSMMIIVIVLMDPTNLGHRLVRESEAMDGFIARTKGTFRER